MLGKIGNRYITCHKNTLSKMLNQYTSSDSGSGALKLGSIKLNKKHKNIPNVIINCVSPSNDPLIECGDISFIKIGIVNISIPIANPRNQRPIIKNRNDQGSSRRKSS